MKRILMGPVEEYFALEKIKRFIKWMEHNTNGVIKNEHETNRKRTS